MATCTWNATVDTDFENDANWGVGGHAHTGDTIVIASATTPESNRPTAGATLNFSVAAALTVTLDNWLDGATIGTVTVNHPGAVVRSAVAVTGTTTVAAGTFIPSANLAGAVTVAQDVGVITIAASLSMASLVNAGQVNVNANCTLTVTTTTTNTSGTISGGELTTAVFAGAVDNTSGVLGVRTMDFNGGLTGDGGTIGEGGAVTITGVVNVTNCTWSVAAGSTLTCDLAGTLNLGAATVANLSVSITHATGTVTLAGTSVAIVGLTLNTAGTLAAGAGYTFTLSGAGAFTNTASTITGTLNVDLSASTGVYTQTAGTIADGGILNVTTGTGAITLTALTKTGTAKINITMAENATIKWALTVSPIDLLTINAGKTGTQTGSVSFRGRAGLGTLASGIFADYWLPTTTAHVCDGPITGTGAFNATIVISLVINTILDLGQKPFVGYGPAGDVTISGLTCANMTLAPYSAATFTLTINGNSSGTTIVLGTVDAADRLGVLILGVGTHTWSGNIARAGTGTANALTAQAGAVVNASGYITLAGIAVDFGAGVRIQVSGGKSVIGTSATSVAHAGGAEIDCQGTGKVTALDASAAAQRLVVRRAVHSSTGIPLRGWNDDSCTNVRFLGRRVIGQAA